MFQGGLQLFWVRQNREDMQACFLLQALERLAILGIQHSHGKHIALAANRITVKLVGKPGIDELLYPHGGLFG